MLLCGSMVGLKMIRHRIFESNMQLPILVPTCHHENVYDPWHKDGVGQREKLLRAMKIDWFMTRQEVREAIPPAYTEFIGKHLMEILHAETDLYLPEGNTRCARSDRVCRVQYIAAGGRLS